VSELKGPTRVILKNDGFPIPRYGFDRTAHLKDAYCDAVIQAFKKNFANALTLLHRLPGLKILILGGDGRFGDGTGCGARGAGDFGRQRSRSKGRFVQSESRTSLSTVAGAAILAAPNERWAIDRSVRHRCLVGARYRRESSNHDHVAFRTGDAPTCQKVSANGTIGGERFRVTSRSTWNVGLRARAAGQTLRCVHPRAAAKGHTT
jgi:hypothetical protein